MNKTLTIKPDVETLLREGGFAFTIVDRCPHMECKVCGPIPRQKAA